MAASILAGAQNSLRVEAPAVVGLDEQFNVTFIIEGEDRPSSFDWSPGSDFKLVWGPQKGSSTSLQIINGKRTKSSQFTYTYILSPLKAGKFELPKAVASVGGKSFTSTAATVEVVSNGASSPSQSQRQGQGRSESSQASSTGDIPSDDLFMRLTLSRTNVVVGEPVTATLKIYQRVNIAGFEDAKFPTFNGFWSQETSAPTTIQFSRESFNDKIYDAAVLRSYVLIPQKSGDLEIDPSELVCLVNLRTQRRSNSIFDDFFDDGYRTVRKRVVTPAVKVHVKPLPGGAPASFGGGVGSFAIDAKLSKDNLKTHEAASLIVTVSGKGNVSLLEAPKINFHPDMDVYDVKSTDLTDKSNGGTSGSKTFEYPFIPRTNGDFVIGPIEYSYYDVNAGKYVTISTPEIPYFVEKGSETASQQGGTTLQSVDRKNVRNLGEDIRYISVKAPSFGGETSFIVGKALYWIIAAIMALAAAAVWLSLRKMAAMKADVAGNRNRGATKMALKRLKQAEEFLRKDLYTAFYEELHRALLGFASDKLAMKMEDLSKDKISERLVAGGVPQSIVDQFVALIDACEFARYSPSGGNEAMSAHYHGAVDVISTIDSSMKTSKSSARSAVIAMAFALAVPSVADAAQNYPDSLWNAGVQAYENGQWDSAAQAWASISAAGCESAEVWYNEGNAWFKSNEYARAVLCYERALKIDPSYSDARFNLEFARTQLQDRIDEIPEFIFKTWLRRMCYAASSNVWAVLALIFFAAALALALLFLLSSGTGKRKTGFFGGIAAMILCLSCLGFARWQLSDYLKADSAIVMRPVSSVKSSPASGSATDLFVLHEGTKVRILDDVGEWKNISLPDGRQGWIRSSDIEVI